MNRKLDKMEYLLANKSYADLLPEEKEWIDQQHNKVEYDRMRNAFLKSKVLFKSERTSPNPEIKSRLRHKLKQHKEPAKLAPMFLYKIPAWQAVAAFALLLFFIPQIHEKPVSDPDQIYIYQTDTVYKEIPVQSIINPIIDTLTGIPKVRKILNRTNRSPIKSSTVVFSKDSIASANLSKKIAESYEGHRDSMVIENIISRYLSDSVKNYRIDIDTGFQNMGRVY